MKLTKEEVIVIVKKVHVDLSLNHDDRYPMDANYFEKGSDDLLDMNHWIAGFNYSDPAAVGDEWIGENPEYIIVIDDELGEAVNYSLYSGHFEIILNEAGNYQVVKQQFRETE